MIESPGERVKTVKAAYSSLGQNSWTEMIYVQLAQGPARGNQRAFFSRGDWAHAPGLVLDDYVMI